MKTSIGLTLALTTLIAAAAPAQPLRSAEPAAGSQKPAARKASKPNPFAAIRVLEGHWRGTGEGEPGKSTVERNYEFVMGGRFLQVRNHSTYPPQEKNRKGEKHEDWGIFSFDKARKKLVLRQFHIEGFVNQYVLDHASSDGKEIVFVTESIENIPSGFRARETYKLADNDTFEETFEIAEPGKDFAVYVVNKLKRVDPRPH
jgi:hypothetical protein